MLDVLQVLNRIVHVMKVNIFFISFGSVVDFLEKYLSKSPHFFLEKGWLQTNRRTDNPASFSSEKDPSTNDCVNQIVSLTHFDLIERV